MAPYPARYRPPPSERGRPAIGHQPAAPTARIRLLGGFDVRVGGRTVIDRDWPNRKAKALLKLVALQPDRSLHRERATEVLWPRLDIASAASNLRKNMHYLRAVLAASGFAMALVLMSQDMLLLSGDVSLDIADFLSLAAAALASACSPASYEKALGLYRGDLLPDDLYQDWTVRRRDELRVVRNDLLLGLGRLYATDSRPDLATERFRQLLGAEPGHEEAHRLLMQMYAKAGNRDRALRQYGTCRDALRREFDTNPSQETQQVYQTLLTT